MRSYHIIWQVVLADFRERTRRYSYLITLMAALFVGYLVLTGKYSFLFGSFKPVYNSPWVGTTVALAGSAMFSLIGFYVVRTAISRDRETRVGEILATTRLSNVSYLLAKFFSNLLVLWSMVAALTISSLAGMMANMPVDQVDLIASLLPFLLFPMVITVPVAGAAVLFDTVRWLRGAVGNILYLFLAELMILSGFLKIPYLDASGMGLFGTSVEAAIHSVYPGVNVPMAMGFVGVFEEAVPAAVKTFEWSGIDISLPLVLSRFIWPAVALVMVSVAALLFDRFEQSKKVSRKKRGKSESSVSAGRARPQAAFVQALSYRDIPAVACSFGIVPLVAAELKLGLKSLNRVWYVIGLILIVGELFAPFDITRQFLVPAAMIWPLAFWSANGTREARFNMRQLMSCSARVHARQYVALLLGGIGIALIFCAPMLIRAVIVGEYVYLLLLISSAFLLPTTAFALGVVSGSKKLFEVSYLIIWYVGSIDHVAAIDLLGTTAQSTDVSRVILFGAITLVAAIVAYVGRRDRVEA